MNDEIFTEADNRFYQWLSLIREPQKIRVVIDGDVIEIHCGDIPEAGKLWRASANLKLDEGAFKHLDIWVNGRRFISTLFPPKLNWP